MKIRSRTELNTALNDAISWRKKEISNLHLLIQNASREHQKEALRRSAVVILYAHWEGFFKFAAECYLNFVLRCYHLYQELTPNFLALACRTAMRDAGVTQRVKAHLDLVEFLLFNQGNQARFGCGVNAEDNLNSDVLRDILMEIGLPYDAYWAAKSLLIDGSLLKNRNSIAHGDYASIDNDTYSGLHALVVELLDYAQTCMENAAELKSYLRQ